LDKGEFARKSVQGSKKNRESRVVAETQVLAIYEAGGVVKRKMATPFPVRRLSGKNERLKMPIDL